MKGRIFDRNIEGGFGKGGGRERTWTCVCVDKKVHISFEKIVLTSCGEGTEIIFRVFDPEPCNQSCLGREINLPQEVEEKVREFIRQIS